MAGRRSSTAARDPLGNVGRLSDRSGAAAQGGRIDANGDLQRDRAIALERDDRPAVDRRPRKAPTALFEELNWDYATIERLNRTT